MRRSAAIACYVFFFQAEDGIRDKLVTGVQTCALPICCGTGGKASAHADQANGAKLFTAKCAGCHVLAAAGSKGTTGPNLDDAFGPSRQQGFKESTIQNVVLDQIREPSPPMPENLVTGSDAQDVAFYVAAVAGVSGASAKPPAQAGNDRKANFQGHCPGWQPVEAAGWAR